MRIAPYGKAPMRNLILLMLLLTAFSLLFSSIAEAGVQQNISATVSQEYNDNINESSHPKTDYITTVSPSYSLKYESSRIAGSIDYRADFHKYDTNQDQDQWLNTLDAKVAVQAIKNFLTFDISDNNNVVFANATQGETRPADATNNQVNQNIFAAGATLTPYFADRTETKFGYKFTKTLYTSVANSNSQSGVNKATQMVFANLLHQLTPKFELGLNAYAQLQSTDQNDTFQASTSALGRYTYGENCYFYASAGAVESNYGSQGSSLKPTWSAGLTHTFSKTAVTLETQGGYEENPSTVDDSFRTLYSITISHDFHRAKFQLNTGYSNFSGQDTKQTSTLTTTAQLAYELSNRLTASLTASCVGSSSSDNDTSRLYGSVELQYLLPKNSSVKLYYRNKYYDASSSSYHVNILGLALTKAF